MSIITREAFERCKNKTLAEQLEQVRQEMREEVMETRKMLLDVAVTTHHNSRRIVKLEEK